MVIVQFVKEKIYNSFDNTIQAEGLSDSFKNVGIKTPNVWKEMAKNVLKKSGRAQEIGASVGSAFRSPKQLCHCYLKWLTFITPEKVFTSVNLYEICYING